MSAATFALLRAAGTSLLLDTAGPRTPRILHWGPDLGALSEADVEQLRIARYQGQGHSSFDEDLPASITYNPAEGYYGIPAVSGHRNGRAFSPLFLLDSVTTADNTVTIVAVDAAAELRLETVLRMTAQGALRISHAVMNTGADTYIVDDVNVALPIPARAVEITDFMGNWGREMHPQTKPIDHGTYMREVREGRTGHDSTKMFLAHTAGASFQQGEVWCVSLAWSGNSRYFVEKLYDGSTRLGTGELLLPGEMILEPGGQYAAPECIATYSPDGLDGIAAVFHEYLRARPQHPRSPRPVTINVWEAVYMDHRFDKLEALADVCAEIGVERFVLDDGWFGARRDDRAGLGDWVVSADAWPQGLAPLADALAARGLEFGLCFEPEMVNADSDLYREHPEWILHVGDRVPPEWRYQQVLDLAHEGAFNHVLGQMDAILTQYPSIRFLKWDHNRPLTDPGHLGRAGVRTQTLAVYRLLDELKRRHPGLEIETCSSGGGRIDLGVMERTDRVHASDCNESLERQRIQRWTTQLLPPEMVDSHIGPTHAHTTGRYHDLGFRAVTALFGHAGIEWDITEATPAEREQLKTWIAYYKANRALLHGGRMVRVDHPSDSSSLHGVVAADRSRAVFAFVQEGVSAASRPIPLRFPGLDPDRRYRVIEAQPAGAPHYWQIRLPKWISEGVELTGRALADFGVQPPILTAEQALVIDITAL